MESRMFKRNPLSHNSRKPVSAKNSSDFLSVLTGDQFKEVIYNRPVVHAIQPAGHQTPPILH